ncbi:hypothetical protein H312_02998 [Anncaliia algerae PRA339]|uniref:Uncharacterized protein n=1 Tax=Anncaliia algerae PRA339 TaxID=1288291 RepID=A0A059EXN7_9MICR|nr:hypothetical protein H312_02998 [Anncaliia algerae PRA339]
MYIKQILLIINIISSSVDSSSFANENFFVNYCDKSVNFKIKNEVDDFIKIYKQFKTLRQSLVNKFINIEFIYEEDQKIKEVIINLENILNELSLIISKIYKLPMKSFVNSTYLFNYLKDKFIQKIRISALDAQALLIIDKNYFKMCICSKVSYFIKNLINFLNILQIKLDEFLVYIIYYNELNVIIDEMMDQKNKIKKNIRIKLLISLKKEIEEIIKKISFKKEEKNIYDICNYTLNFRIKEIRKNEDLRMLFYKLYYKFLHISYIQQSNFCSIEDFNLSGLNNYAKNAVAALDIIFIDFGRRKKLLKFKSLLLHFVNEHSEEIRILNLMLNECKDCISKATDDIFCKIDDKLHILNTFSQNNEYLEDLILKINKDIKKFEKIYLSIVEYYERMSFYISNNFLKNNILLFIELYIKNNNISVKKIGQLKEEILTMISKIFNQ